MFDRPTRFYAIRPLSVIACLVMVVDILTAAPVVHLGPHDAQPISSTTSQHPTTNQVVTTGWTNPGNVAVDDNVYATTAPAISNTVETRWKGFDFSSIPSNAIITGVTLRTRYYVSTTTGVATLFAQLTVGSTEYPTSALQDGTEPTAETTKIFTFTNAKTWTQADLVDANFGVRLGARRSTSTSVIFYLDDLYLTIDYQLPPTLNQSAYRWYNGSPNAMFGANGYLSPGMAYSNRPATDGTYLYTAGTNTLNNWVTQKRLLSDGSLVSGYGTAGEAAGASGAGVAMAISIDGTYSYVAGYTSGTDFFIEKRLLSTGALDAGFGTSGTVTGVANSQMIYTMAIDSTYMYVVGTDSTGGWRIEKRNLSNGALVSGFGTSGVILSGSSSGTPWAAEINGSYLFIAGSSNTNQGRMEKRLLTTGALDNTYGTSGVVSNSNGYYAALTIYSNNTYATYQDGSSTNFAIEKRSTSGALDGSFGTSGVKIGDSYSWAPNAIAIDSSGVYIGGDEQTSAWRVEKHDLTTGAVVNAFGLAGIQDDYTGTNPVRGLVLSGTSLYSVGTGSGGYMSISQRNATTGALLTGYETTPVAAQDTGYTATTTENLRLKTVLSITTDPLPSGTQFKLQVAPRVGGACGGGDETFADISTGAGAIRMKDNPYLTNNATASSDSNDPKYSAQSDYAMYYMELADTTFAARTGVPVSSGAMWDFAIDQSNATPGSTYCFQIKNYDGSSLATYTQFPTLTISSPNSPPSTPTSLAQYKSDGTTSLAIGGWSSVNSVVLKATVSDPDGNQVQLCVENTSSAFASPASPATCGSLANSGTTASVTVTGLTTNTQYRWQVKALDSNGAYSSSYAQFNSGSLSYGVDLNNPPAPTTVYDGTSIGSDALYNTGALDTLSANWTAVADTGGSGVAKYQYAIGTTSGGTDIRTWTDNGTTSVTATGLTLRTGQAYYVTVIAFDNSGRTSAAGTSSDGQVVAPTLTFSVSTTTLNFNNLRASNSYTDSQAVTVTTSTNAYGGYVVRAYANGNLTSGASTIPNFNGGTYATPDTWQAGETGFGFTSDDTSIQGSNKFQATTCPGGTTKVAPGCFATVTNTGPGDIVADHASGIAGSPIAGETFTITYRTTVAGGQKAGKYSNIISFSVTATY